MATVLLIGTLDTKGPETAMLRDRVQAWGGDTIVMDAGILGEAIGIMPDIDRRAVAAAADTTIDALRNAGTRGKAVEHMLIGVRRLALDLRAAGRIHGVAALGGAEGSVLAAAAMKEMPIGFPKLIVSPIASGQRRFAPLVGYTDVTVMHSVVDILGVNAISRAVFDNAAAAIAGMAIAYERRGVIERDPARRQIAATMLGNTTRPLMRIKPRVDAVGADLVIFHANGVGGRAMEGQIAAGLFDVVLDYTLSEIAGQIAGGFHVAGETRMDAAGAVGIPQIVVPGCLDFIVFGARDEVPERFRDRPMYYHNPEFTLVRLTADEQRAAARLAIGKLQQARGAVTVMIPARGGSVMENADGGTFWDADLHAKIRRMFHDGLRDRARVIELDAHINDDRFADAVGDELLKVI